MNLVRDLLDKQVVDRNGREMGRVDGVVLEQRRSEPPRLAGILIGASALGDRVHPAIGCVAAALELAFGVNSERPIRIDVSDLSEIDRQVTIDRSIGETAADAVEKGMRAWITKIPGAR